MNFSDKRRSLAGICSFLVLTLAAGSAWAQAASAEDGGNGPDPQRTARLLETAKKEGEFTIYVAHPTMPQIAAAFTKKYGIKVNIWRAGSEAVLQRVTNEVQGKRFVVDIVENNAPEMEALHRAGILQALASPHVRELMPQAVRPHNEWVGISIDMFVLGYNRNMISKDQLPKTWAELAAPKWKGQIGAEADDSAWFATLLEDLGREPGLKAFREIVDKNTVSMRKGHSLLGKLVAAGEVPLAINLYSWNVDQLKETGAPIERFDIGAPVAQFQGLGIAKRAPNPASAALFVDFILTEGQAIISKQHAIATSNRFDAAQKSRPIAFIDPVVAMDRYDVRQKEYQDLFIKKR